MLLLRMSSIMCTSSLNMDDTSDWVEVAYESGEEVMAHDPVSVVQGSEKLGSEEVGSEEVTKYPAEKVLLREEEKEQARGRVISGEDGKYASLINDRDEDKLVVAEEVQRLTENRASVTWGQQLMSAVYGLLQSFHPNNNGTARAKQMVAMTKLLKKAKTKLIKMTEVLHTADMQMQCLRLEVFKYRKGLSLANEENRILHLLVAVKEAEVAAIELELLALKEQQRN